MERKDLVNNVVQSLKDNGIKKSIKIKKHIFHIQDNEGNSAFFTVKEKDKMAAYNNEDVRVILEATLNSIVEALAQGDVVDIRGFGTFSLKHRKAKKMKRVNTGENIEIEDHYTPKFKSGYKMRRAGKVYKLLLDDIQANQLPVLDDDDEEYEEDDD